MLPRLLWTLLIALIAANGSALQAADISSAAAGEWFPLAANPTWVGNIAPSSLDRAILGHAVDLDVGGVPVTVQGVNFIAGGSLRIGNMLSLDLTQSSTWLDSSLDLEAGTSFNIGAGATVFLNDGSLRSHSATGTGTLNLLTGGTLDGLPGSGVSGVLSQLNYPGQLFQWQGGSMIDGTIENGSTGQINLAGAAGKTINGALLNSGTFVHGGTGNLTLTGAQALTNAAGGIYDFAGDADVVGSGTLTNLGTIVKSAGLDISDITGTLVNTGGTIDAQSGSLRLAPISNIENATYTVAAGADISLISGRTLLLTTTNSTRPPSVHSGTGAGSFIIAAGSTLDGLTGSGVTGSPAVQLDFQGSLLQWQGGTLVDGLVENINQMNLVGASPKTISGRLLNSATILHSGTGGLGLAGFGLINSATGIYQFDSDASITDAGSGRFDNFGTLRKAAGTGTSTIGGRLNNDGGTLEALTGTLRLATTNIFADTTYNVAPGAVMELANSRTLQLTADNSVATPTQHVGTGGGTFLVSPTSTLDGLSGGGVVGVTAQLSFPGAMFRWEGGTLVDGTVENIDQINLAGNQGKLITGRLLNSATILHQDTGSLSLSGLALINALGATYEIQGDSDVLDAGSGQFQNFGTLAKSSGIGTTILNGTLTNDGGLIEVQSGELQLAQTSNFDNTSYQIDLGAQITLPTGRTLRLTSTNSVSPPTLHTGTGAGQFIVSGGTLDGLTGGGIINVTSQLSFAGDLFQWRSGTLIDGTVENIDQINLTGAQNRTIAGRLLNSGLIRHLNSGALTLQNLALTNAATGTYDFAGDASIADGGSGQFANFGVLRKSAGTGVSRVSGTLTNDGGTIDVQSGTLRLEDTALFDNTTYQLATDTRLELLTGSTLLLTSTNSSNPPTLHQGTGNGRVILNGGTLDGLNAGGIVGITAQLNFPADMFQWQTGTFVDGTIENIGQLNLVGGNPKDITGRLQNSGLMILGSTGALQLTNNALVNTAAGTFQIDGNANINNTTGARISNSGTLEKISGTGLSIIAATIDHSAGVIAANAGELSLAGTLNFTGGAIAPSGSARISHGQNIAVPNGGSLRGTGTIEAPAIEVSGTIDPGAPVGTLTLDTDLTLLADGTANLEIAGLANSDVVNVTGLFSPGGQFNIEFISGYAPSAGDQFTLLTSGGFTGSIDVSQFTIFGLAAGAQFTINEVAGNLVLEAVNNAQPDLPLVDVPPPQALVAGDRFGGEVDVDGNWLVVGVPGLASSGTGTGAIAIYEVSGGAPVLDSLFQIPVGFTGSGFGTDVAVSGDTIVAGTDGAPVVQKGPAAALAAAIFQRTSGVGWEYKQPLAAASGSAGDGFGSAVSIDDNVVAIGAPADGAGETTASGAAYIFQRPDGLAAFTEMAKVKPPILDSGARFGAAVSVRNDKLAVGAPLDKPTGGATTGSVSVFGALSAAVNRLGTMAGSDSDDGAEFGAAVDVDEDGTVIVGAPMETAPGTANRQGAVYLLTSGGGTLSQTNRITPQNPATGSDFGRAVTIDPGGIAVGAPKAEVEGIAAGLVRRFNRSTLVEGSPIRAGEGQTGFGGSVSISADKLAIGSPDTANFAGAASLVLDPDRVFSDSFE